MVIIIYMSKRQVILFPAQTILLKQVGRQIQLARLKRDITSTRMSLMTGLTRVTLTKIEKGDPTVSIGAYLKVLARFDLADSILELAKNDPVGDKLQEAKLELKLR